MQKNLFRTLVLASVSMSLSAQVTYTENFSNDTEKLETVIVTANRFDRKAYETTYASEVHTAKEIANSGLTTLYDFFAQKTSLNISSSYGSQLTPSIDVRGYGLEAGYQNVVITVDGQRLNNVDGISQLIAAIPLNNIDRIEITKGSGSVIYGDGATGGSIQIYTKNKTGVTASGSGGNYGGNNEYINAGLSERYIDLSASASRDTNDGYMQRDSTGTSNGYSSNAQNGKLKLKPLDSLSFTFDITNSINHITFENYLTPQQFNSNPTTYNSTPYGQSNAPYPKQLIDTNQYRLGGEYKITNSLTLIANHNIEEKVSSYYGSPSYNYDYQSNDFSLKYDKNQYSAIVGYKDFDGKRSQASSYTASYNSIGNTTSKNNQAFFINTEYRPDWLTDRLILSAGGRDEFVNYSYNPIVTSALSSNLTLNAWDFGANFKILEKLSIFSNFNKAYQAPDIDRFFNPVYDLNYNVIGAQFNGFIKPAQVTTLNVGLNYEIADNRLKATAFRSNLHDEIYYAPSYLGGVATNTNIDKSHKYGFEIQDYYKFSEEVSASVIYSYTKAMIDVSSYAPYSNGNQLPGVPKSSISANLNYQIYTGLNFTLSQSYRSSSYAIGNFANDPAFKQNQYESTNLILNYKIKNYTFFGSMNNLFEHRNNLVIGSSSSSLAIYPVDFVRTWRLGVKLDF